MPRSSILLMALACVVPFHASAAEPLSIIKASIQQIEGGTPVPPGFTHIPGEVLFFSFQVDGYRVSPDRKVKLSYRIEALDPAGVPIIEPVEGSLDTELSVHDKEWQPKVRHEIPIPPLAPPGTYHINVVVNDQLAEATAKTQVVFVVRGHEVEPSPSLVIRNFRFFRSEEDTSPLEHAVYRPGDAVWARFDITGYKFGQGNKLEVSYGVAVLDGTGKVLWSNPEAATEKTQSFYPQRYVPGSMALNLESDIRPGIYTVAITARDQVGNQTSESKHDFSIE